MTHASLHRVVTFPAVLLTLAILAHSACSQAATAPTTLPAPDEPFPILAWGGPPQAQVTPERLRELAEAGINIDYSGFSDAKAMAAALDVAKGAGVKLLVACPELKSDPVGTVNRFKDHPAVGGYFLVDEPAAGAFAELGGVGAEDPLGRRPAPVLPQPLPQLRQRRAARCGELCRVRGSVRPRGARCRSSRSTITR